MSAGVTTMARPTTPQPAVSGEAVRCARCGQILCLYQDGALWLRHRGLTLLIEGLTPAQRARIWCPNCWKETEIAA